MDNNTQIIAVHSAKGGVGKSTMASTLAAGMATLGLNVALVDTDSQGHASLLFAMPDENGLYYAMIEKRPLASVIRPVPFDHYSDLKPPSGSLWLLPSSDLTYKIPLEIKADDTFFVLDMFAEMASGLDLDAIIIDTSPSLTGFDGTLWMAIDWFLFVTECERLSADGLVSAIGRMKRFGVQREKYLGRRGRVLGILPNKLKANTLLQRTVIGQLAEEYQSDVWSPVVDRIAWAEAAYMQKSIFQHQPNGQASKDAWTMVRKAMEVLNVQPRT